jgi:glutamyl-tRNA reductase
LGQLSPEQEQALEALTHGIVNKILHTPITRLKSAAAGPEVTTLIDAFKKIFNLQDKSADEKPSAKAEAGSGSRSR